MYKAVINDLDGTLLNDRSKISDFTRETVRELIDRGIFLLMYFQEKTGLYQ